jgi:hypothetical protein
MKTNKKELYLKKQIMDLILNYKEQLKYAELELGKIEYEAFPSGEMNESIAMMAPWETEINNLEVIISDLQLILKT